MSVRRIVVSALFVSAVFLFVGAVFLTNPVTGGSGAAAQTPAPETRKTLDHGEVVGLITGNGAHAWRSLPYGASSAGVNRWRAPQPVTPWSDTRAATEFGPRCPQNANFFNAVDGIEPGELFGSEDCLTLDVYAPPDAAGKSLPVMVWIHGGSNVTGSSQIYDGANLARNENVIIIGVQYRLGPLGWFSHPAFEEEGANFGTLDLIAALHWVQANAAAFGGDPDLVTIFGESAGGQNVATLLAAPKARGLFHRAIMQSGGFDSVSIEVARGTSEAHASANTSLAIAKKLEAHNATALRAISLEALFGAYEKGNRFTNLPTVIEDGVVLPKEKLRTVFASAQNFHTVPIITGINRDEMKLFQIANKRLIRKIFGRLYVARNQKFYDSVSNYSSRVWRVRSVDGPAARMAAGGHDQVYAYRFDWDDGGSFLMMNLAKVLGAAHGMEIPFVFNRFQLLGDADRIMFQKKTLASREKLSRTMGAYWASFARTGVPSATGAPAWPVYTTNGATLLRLDAVRRVKKDRGIELITGADSIEKILADLKADRQVNDAQRCRIAQTIGAWVPSLAHRVRSEICPPNNPTGGR